MDLKDSWPAVSQIWSLTFLSPTWTMRAPNSTPMVTSCFWRKRPSMNWSRRQDLPTPVSPMMMNLNRQGQDAIDIILIMARSIAHTINGPARKYHYSKGCAAFQVLLQKYQLNSLTVKIVLQAWASQACVVMSSMLMTSSSKGLTKITTLLQYALVWSASVLKLSLVINQPGSTICEVTLDLGTGSRQENIRVSARTLSSLLTQPALQLIRYSEVAFVQLLGSPAIAAFKDPQPGQLRGGTAAANQSMHQINQRLAWSSSDPRGRGRGCCLQNLAIQVRRSLYNKYSESLVYHLIRDIDQLLEEATTPNTLRFTDILQYHREEETLHQAYRAPLLFKKLDSLRTTKHQSFPRIFTLPEYVLLSENHGRHDRLEQRRRRRKPKKEARGARTNLILDPELLGEEGDLDCTGVLKQMLCDIFRERSQRQSIDAVMQASFDGAFSVANCWTPQLSEICCESPAEFCDLQTALKTAFQKKAPPKKQNPARQPPPAQPPVRKRQKCKQKRSSMDAKPSSSGKQANLERDLQRLKKRIREMKIMELRKCERSLESREGEGEQRALPEPSTGTNTNNESRRVERTECFKSDPRQTLLTIPDQKEPRPGSSKKTNHFRTASDQSMKAGRLRRQHKYTRSSEVLAPGEEERIRKRRGRKK